MLRTFQPSNFQYGLPPWGFEGASDTESSGVTLSSRSNPALPPSSLAGVLSWAVRPVAGRAGASWAAAWLVFLFGDGSGGDWNSTSRGWYRPTGGSQGVWGSSGWVGGISSGTWGVPALKAPTLWDVKGAPTTPTSGTTELAWLDSLRRKASMRPWLASAYPKKRSTSPPTLGLEFVSIYRHNNNRPLFGRYVFFYRIATGPLNMHGFNKSPESSLEVHVCVKNHRHLYIQPPSYRTSMSG